MKNENHIGLKAVLFDFDGTLADTKECGIKATISAFQDQGLNLPTKAAIEYYMGIPIEQSFKEMAEQDLSASQLEELMTVFRSHYARFEQDLLKLFPNVEQVLQGLKNRNLQLFVLSSKKSTVLLRNLQSLKIASYFTEVIGSDKVSHYKPHPEGVNKILTTYSLAPQESIMVGDATFDMEMGKAAGVWTCAVTWGSHSLEQLQTSQPDFLIHTAPELLSLIVEKD